MSIPDRQLPNAANLEHLRKQARDLQRAHQAGQTKAMARIRFHLPKLAKASDTEITSAKFPRTSAQLVVAREYGFASWPLLVQAVESRAPYSSGMKSAIENGDAPTITRLLHQDPTLRDQEFEWTDRKDKQRRITPIRYAHACDQQASFDALTEAGVSNKLGTALWHNSYNLNLAQVQRLLARGVDPGHGMQTAQVRIGRGRNAIIEALIEAGGVYQDGPCMDLHRGRLKSLARRVQTDPSLLNELFEDCLDNSDSVLHPQGPPQKGTLLHIAAAHNDQEALEVLLAQGADIDARASVAEDGSGRQTAIFFTIGREEARDLAQQRRGLPSFDTCEQAFEALLAHDADLSLRADCKIRDSVLQLTPLAYALTRQESERIHRPRFGKAFEADREIERLRSLGAPS